MEEAIAMAFDRRHRFVVQPDVNDAACRLAGLRPARWCAAPACCSAKGPLPALAPVLLVVALLVALSGCLNATHGNFPPCNADAPAHLEVHLSWASDNNDADIVGQNAVLQGWTNVVVHAPAFTHAWVEGDCAKAV